MERDYAGCEYCNGVTISTHTLTWSVTFAQIGGEGLDEYFNSHAHVERDVAVNSACIHVLHFNSHAHVERDLLERQDFICFSNFNSHAHVERDVRLWKW